MPGRYDIFGNKRVVKNQTKLKSTEWDITKEKLKIVLLIFLSILWIYFVILGKTI